MQNMSSGVHEGVMAEETGTTPVRSEDGTVPAPAPRVDAAGEADCERCHGSGRITLINVDLGGGFYGDADDQPCPECGE